MGRCARGMVQLACGDLSNCRQTRTMIKEETIRPKTIKEARKNDDDLGSVAARRTSRRG